MGRSARKAAVHRQPPPFDLAGRRVLVVGAARTGVATANFLVRRGALVTITDSRGAASLAAHLPHLDDRVNRELGGHRAETFFSQDLIVPSPGVPKDDALLSSAHGAGISVLSEIELAGRFLPVPLIAVTGTNGKSTTVSALGAVLEEAGIEACVGGNIGNPLIGEVDGMGGKKYVVAEISSFQLEWIESFRPRIAAILNITEDHLDRYRSFDDYVAAKKRIFENQEPDDYLVINGDDRLVREVTAGARCRTVVFSRRMTPLFGVYLFRGWIHARLGRGMGKKVLPVDELLLRGEHNWENALAVTAMAMLAGASPENVRRALGRFRGLPHRTEYVREVGGVTYYDDSKATNVGAAVKTVAGFSGKSVVLLGGKDKGGSYAPLASTLEGRARAAVVMGEATERIRSALGGVVPVVAVEDMEEAVREASRRARPGDAVILSPACSSFDRYKSYAERGRHFQQEVQGL